MKIVLLILILTVPGTALAQIDTDSFVSVSRAAAAAMAENRLGEAIQLYSRAVELSHTWNEGWWYLGVLQYDLKNYREGWKAFRVVTHLEPRMGMAWLMLGLCQYELKNYDLALPNFTRAINLGLGQRPDLLFTASLHKAMLQTRIEEYELAFNLLFPLAAHHSTNRQVIGAMGVCALRMPYLPHELPAEKVELVGAIGQAFTYAALEDVDKANSRFQQMIEKYPDEPNVHYAYGQFLRVRNSDEALTHFQKELEISPDHIPARLQIAWHYLRKGTPEKGVPLAEEVLRFRTDSFSAHYVLGRLFFDMGNADKAIPELEAVVKAVPNSMEVRNVLAQALWKTGRREEAQKQLEEVRRLRNLKLESERGLVASGAEGTLESSPQQD